MRVRRHCAVAGAALLLQALALEAQEHDYITVTSWGGSYNRACVKAYHERFTQETGIRIKLEEYNGGLAQIRAQVETGHVNWDVVDMDTRDTLLACDEGLLEEADYESLPPAPDGTPASSDFVAGYDVDCGVKSLFFSMIYAYNEEKLTGPRPATMADFFDTETFPGRRGLRRGPNVNLEFALVADGVPVDQIYEVLSTPAGVDRAFRKLDLLKPQAVWWETGAQPPQMLADGEVVMSMAANGRIFTAQTLDKQPLVIVWDGQLLMPGHFAIVAGTPRLEAARRFIAFASSTQSLANITKYIAYGPMRRSAMALADKHETGIDIKPHLPNWPANTANAVIEDVEWWADNQDDMNERFAAWLLR